MTLRIQQEILGNENQDLDLESAIKIIEAKEAGRRSQASFIAEGAHAVSQHKKSKNNMASIDRTAVCEKCHQQFTRPLGYRGKVRPHKMCKQCFKLQENLASKSTTGSASEESGNLVDMICPVAVTGPMKQKPIVLSHHVFSDDKGWLQR